MASLVVYTAIMGNIRDTLRSPAVVSSPHGDIQFVCFTDRPHPEAGVWQVRPPIWEHDTSPRRTARWHKVRSREVFPDADYTVWVDGSMRLQVDPWLIVQERLIASAAVLAVSSHPQRQTVAAEVVACVRLRKDDPELLKRQLQRYQDAAFTDQSGLYETGLLARGDDARLAAFERDWWWEIEIGSLRDQVSFPYVLSRHPLPIDLLPGSPAKSPYVRLFAHK